MKASDPLDVVTGKPDGKKDGALTRRDAVKARVRACESRLGSIDLLVSKPRDKTLLCRHLADDVLACLATLHQLPDGIPPEELVRRIPEASIDESMVAACTEALRANAETATREQAEFLADGLRMLVTGLRGLVDRSDVPSEPTPKLTGKQRLLPLAPMAATVLLVAIIATGFAMRIRSDNARALFFDRYADATVALQVGRYEVAVSQLRAGLSVEPAPAAEHLADAYNNLGLGLIHLGEYQEAVSALEKAISLRDNSARAKANLRWVEKLIAESAASDR
jgi:tetratricopeptide (TPR) repeat protein